MKQRILRPASLVLGLALLASRPAAAQKFDQYVALGDSLTAGWQSRLPRPAQPGQLVPGGDRESDAGPGLRAAARLGGARPESAPGYPSPRPGVHGPPATVTVAGLPDGSADNTQLPRPYNNLGIPGIEVQEVLTLTHGDPNGTSLEQTSALVLRNVTGSPFDGTNAVQQADALIAPAAGSNTLSTVWYGNNNTLGASTSAIAIDGVTLISQADFQASYPGDPRGPAPDVPHLVLVNIPDVIAIPFSTTIPPVLVDPATRQPVIIGGSARAAARPRRRGLPVHSGAPDRAAGCRRARSSTCRLRRCSPRASASRSRRAGPGRPCRTGFIDGHGVPHPGVVLYPGRDRRCSSSGPPSTTRSSPTPRPPPARSLVDANAMSRPDRRRGIFSIGGIHADDRVPDGGHLLLRRRASLHDRVHGHRRRDHQGAERGRARRLRAAQLFRRAVHAGRPGHRGRRRASTGGPWGFTYDMWRGVLGSVSSKASSMVLPSVPARPVVPRAGPEPRAASPVPGRSPGLPRR